MEEGPGFTVQDALSKGAQCLRDRKYQDAVGHFTDAVALKPDCFQGYMGLGLAHACLGNYELAADAFASCLRIEPKSARAWHNLATALQALGETERAVEYYRRAASLDPAYEAPRRALAEMARSPAVSVSDAQILCHCPKCGTPARKHSPSTHCKRCGMDLSAVFRGYVTAHRDLDGRDTFTCALCGVPVEDITGECHHCGMVFCTQGASAARASANKTALPVDRRHTA
ncbi:MAG: tetratricopeptide repeat protein [Armatimonadota bacterium]